MFLKAEFYSKHFGKLLLMTWLAGAGLLLASAFVGRGGTLITGDSVHYYEYARALIYEGHLPDQAIAYPCGTAVLGLPGTIAGRVMGSLFGIVPDGRHLLHELMYCLGLSLFGVAALYVNVTMLLRLGFNRPTACTTSFFVLIASNLGFYVLKEPAMSECVTYFMVSLFYCQLVGMRLGRPSIKDWFVLGLTLGMCFAIRQQSLLHAIAIPLALWIPTWKLGGVTVLVVRGGAAIFGGAATMILPYLAWYAATGEFQAAHYRSLAFDFFHPHLWDVLFTFKYHGLFTWCPIFLLAIPGWWHFRKQDAGMTAAFLVPALLQIYLIASWLSWWFGDGFGNRGFFTIYPALLPGIAFVIAHFVGHRRERRLFGGLLILVIVNTILMGLIAMGKLPTNPEIWENWGWWPL